MSASQTKALRSMAEPIVAGHDCELEDVIIRRAGKRRLVRLVVDHAAGLSLDLVAAISRDLSRALDDSTVLGDAPYVLEVSSPGVDRPLREPRHWDRAVGRIVRVTRSVGPPIEGRVLSRAQGQAVLDLDGRPVTIDLAEVTRATVQVEFSRMADAQLSEFDDPEEPDTDVVHAEER